MKIVRDEYWHIRSILSLMPDERTKMLVQKAYDIGRRTGQSAVRECKNCGKPIYTIWKDGNLWMHGIDNETIWSSNESDAIPMDMLCPERCGTKLQDGKIDFQIAIPRRKIAHTKGGE